MKKIFCIILIIFLFLTPTACSKGISSPSSILKKFDIDDATKTVNFYMNDIMKKDISAASKLYASEFKKSNSEKNEQDVTVNGYLFDEITQSGDMGVIKVKVNKINNKTPYASLETETFKVVKEKNLYRIKSIDTENEKEIFVGENNSAQIRIRSKNNIKTNLLTNFDGMPKYYYVQEDKARNNKIPISVGQYGLIGISFDGSSGFVTTKGKNPYIEVINLDESMMTQGGTGSQGSGDSGGDAGGAGQTPKNEMAPETPVGKELVPLEVIPDAVIENTIYSQDNRYLVVQFTKNNSGSTLKMYKCKDGEGAGFDFEKNYPMEKVDVKIVNFVKKGLIYQVTPKQDYVKDKSIKSIIGTWQIDPVSSKTKLVDEKKANISN
ncbi:hypothetical protein [Clostridium akagii]|uniref:hypothetical protein n=1 Tax=Clostridium akagii TaxID=91623 RepID=UPI00047B7923|nr:hypothetical protein [Clostridium akagii]